MIARRAFIVGGVAVIAAPFAVEAQQAEKTPHLGVLASEPWAAIDGLKEGLRQLGYVDGRTIFVDYRWSHGRSDQLEVLAAGLA